MIHIALNCTFSPPLVIVALMNTHVENPKSGESDFKHAPPSATAHEHQNHENENENEDSLEALGHQAHVV